MSKRTPLNGDPCICGDKATWHKECYRRAQAVAYEPGGWLEAAVAWEVCASIHETWAKGKDALYKTRHADFVKHADDARKKHAAEPAQPEPVAWISEYGKDGYAGAARRVFLEDPSTMYPNSRITPLYASPPAQPEPLTAEQVRDLAKSAGLDWQRGYVVDDFSNRYDEFARAIERAIRETTT